MPNRHPQPGSPGKHSTGEQLRVQSEITTLAAAWNAATDEQRRAWCADAQNNRRGGYAERRRMRRGRNLFFRVNSRRLALRQPLFADPPDSADYVPLPIVKLIIINSADRITLKLRISGGDPAGVMVSIWRPLNPGVMRWRKFVRIGPLPPPRRGLCDITSLYVEKYGVPPVGKKIFVRIQQMQDYKGSLASVASAVVPGEEHWDDA